MKSDMNLSQILFIVGTTLAGVIGGIMLADGFLPPLFWAAIGLAVGALNNHFDRMDMDITLSQFIVIAGTTLASLIAGIMFTDGFLPPLFGVAIGLVIGVLICILILLVVKEIRGGRSGRYRF